MSCANSTKQIVHSFVVYKPCTHSNTHLHSSLPGGEMKRVSSHTLWEWILCTNHLPVPLWPRLVRPWLPTVSRSLCNQKVVGAQRRSGWLLTPRFPHCSSPSRFSQLNNCTTELTWTGFYFCKRDLQTVAELVRDPGSEASSATKGTNQGRRNWLGLAGFRHASRFGEAFLTKLK